MNTLRFALIQLDLIWESVEENLKQAENSIKDIRKPFDVVVLPEMFTTGFSISNPQMFTNDAEKTVSWMKGIAKELSVAVCGSIIVEDGGKIFNRLIFVTEDSIEHYDKRHLFSLSGEDEKFSPGTSRKVVEFKKWRINLQVCYDLRFPVFSRNMNDYDVVLYVANWPDKRVFAWNALLSARAIENQSYVVGVNRVGKDGFGYYHSGHSKVVSFTGETINEVHRCLPGAIVVEIEREPLDKYRKKLPFLNDRDSFTVDP